MAKTDTKKKDNFFIKKKDRQTKNSPSHSASSSGDFFITSSKRHEAPAKQANRTKNSAQPKKPFDKKKWRIKKYSKKYKLEQWENKRKKHVLEEYYKEIKDDEPKFDVKKIYEKYGDEEDDNDNNLNKDLSIQGSRSDQEKPAQTTETSVSHGGKKNKAYKKAKSEFQRIQDEKKRKREEMVKQKAERAEALKQYKAKKLEKYKKLNKKTKRGQPIMKYRMEMLLEQIQNSMS